MKTSYNRNNLFADLSLYVLIEGLHTWMVDEPEDADYYFRPYLLLLIETNSLALIDFYLAKQEPSPEMIMTFLTNAMKGKVTIPDPKMKPFKPKMVTFESDALYQSLKHDLADLGIKSKLGHRTVQLASIMHDIKNSTPHFRENTLPGLLSSGKITPKQARAFYQAANDFFFQYPWEYFDNDDYLWIEVPSIKKGFVVTVMGEAEVEYGLALFKSPEQALAIEDPQSEEFDIPYGGYHTMSYNEPPYYSTYDLDYITANALSVPGKTLIPTPQIYYKTKNSRPDATMLLWYEAAMKAIPIFIDQHRQALAERSADAIEAQITVPTSQQERLVIIRKPAFDRADFPSWEDQGRPAGSRPSVTVNPVEYMGNLAEMVEELEGVTTPANQKKAQDLIYDAWENRDQEGRIKLAKKALKLWPDCADAYNVLADEAAGSPQERLDYYAKGIEAGKRALGEAFLADEENVGYYWGMLETRPYMRALQGTAQVYYEWRRYQKAEEIYKHMLTLNPSDNQGVRYTLMEIYLTLQKFDEAQALMERYDEDSPDFIYTKALISFKEKGDCEESRALLLDAFERNDYVPAFLSLRERINFSDTPYITFGEKDEAVDFARRHLKFWRHVPGALAWLEKIADEEGLLPD